MDAHANCQSGRQYVSMHGVRICMHSACCSVQVPAASPEMTGELQMQSRVHPDAQSLPLVLFRGTLVWSGSKPVTWLLLLLLPLLRQLP